MLPGPNIGMLRWRLKRSICAGPPSIVSVATLPSGTGPFAPGTVSLLTDMLAIGEESGDMSGALEHIGRRYDNELDRAVKILTTLIQADEGYAGWLEGEDFLTLLDDATRTVKTAP